MLFEYPEHWFESRPVREGITIDSISTQDMDDGIMIYKLENGWKAEVSIADVSAIIQKDSEEDLIAREQAFTLYRPKGSIPMFPSHYDRDQLSLAEGLLRPAITVEIMLNNDFDVINTNIFKSAFKNLKKTSYEEVHAALKNNDVNLTLWRDFASGLLKKRRLNAALVFYDLIHARALDEEGNLKQLTEETQYAYLIIQELMILTNSVVASFMHENSIPCIYRNHAADVTDNLEIENLVYDIKSAFSNEKEIELDRLKSNLSIWAKRAFYSIEGKGHFGVQLRHYCHFTSPIRRYTDFVNHTNLSSFLNNNKYVWRDEELESLSRHLNRRLDEEKDRDKTEAYQEIVKDKAAFGLRNNNNSSYFDKQDDNVFREMWRQVAESGKMNFGLLLSFENRMKNTDITSKTVFEVLKLSKQDKAWHAKVYKIIENWFDFFPEQAIMMLEHMISVLPEWKGRGEISHKNEMGTFGHLLYIDGTAGKIFADSFFIRQNKRISLQHAAANIILNYMKDTLKTECPIVFDESLENKAMEVEGKNPVSALNEYGQKTGAGISWKDRSEGESHRPVFSCELLVILKDHRFGSSGTGKSKKDARAQAAHEMMKKLPLGVNEKDEDMSTALHNRDDPVSLLMEYCQHHKTGMPEFIFTKTGADHRPLFECKGVLRVGNEILQGFGKSASKKQAKKLASADILLKTNQV